MDNELAFLPIKQLVCKIKKKDLSPVEVTDYFLDRIDKRNPSLNALVFVDHEGAKRRAKEAEDLIMHGDITNKPLFGVPVVAKDIGPSLPGWPDTMGGVRALKGFSLNHTSWFMDRMINAGAIPVGKSNTPVFAFRGVTDNYLFGAANNPFCMGYNPGGSSGGSCAAVVDGLVPIAEGSDAGGSIRIPAAWTNLFGFKASFGRFPGVHRPNAYERTHILMVMGPIGRTVEDVAVALNACRGADEMDPLYVDKMFDYEMPLFRNIKGMRIAYSLDFGLYGVEPEIKEMVKDAVKKFEEAGAEVIPVDLKWDFSIKEATELWCRMCAVTTLINIQTLGNAGIKIPDEDMTDVIRKYLDEVGRMSLVDSLADEMFRTRIYDQLEMQMKGFDLLVTPTLACHPPKNSDDGNTSGPEVIDGKASDPAIGFGLTFLTNITGHASASVPIGISKDGFPVGMQLIGKRFGDSDVLMAAGVFEKMKPWIDSFKITQDRALN